LATAIVIAVVVGAVAVAKHTSQASPMPQSQRPPRLHVIVDPRSGDVRPMLMTLKAVVQRHQAGQIPTVQLVRPVTYRAPTR
jgi:hypothetical protein